MTDASARYRETLLTFFRERQLDTMAAMAALLRSGARP
jgi:hypothetical protein